MGDCPSRVVWWGGEYEGDCLLPFPHLPVPHFDGLSWWNQHGDDVTWQMEDPNPAESYARRAANVVIERGRPRT